MKTTMDQLTSLNNKNFEEIEAKDFEDFIVGKLLKNDGDAIQRQIFVCDRGDGRRGKVDLLYTSKTGERFGIEIDRKTPRHKSIYKLNQLDVDRRIIIVRSPFHIIEI